MKKLYWRDVSTIRIYEDICKGCGICVEFCPLQVLERSKEMNKKGYYPPKLKSAEKCTACRICELMCPDFAIVIIESPNALSLIEKE